MIPRTLVITGTPGVGKTTLAKSMARRLGMAYVSLNDIVKTEQLYTKFDRKSGSYVINSAKVKRRISSILGESDKIIVDTGLVANLLPQNKNIFAVVLRLDPIILLKRLRQRGWNRTKSWENVEAELIDLVLTDTVSWLGKSHVAQINCTGKSKSSILTETMKIVSGKKKKDLTHVNWLQKYDPIELSRKL